MYGKTTQAVLIHSPDRLSRKYAYQVLLTEEFARHGVEVPYKSLVELRAVYMPDAARAVSGHPPS